ncbi:MAG: guanine deaminase [Rhodothermales bacterium]|jgi:guanine deaminase
MDHEAFIREAIASARLAAEGAGGGPFGAVIVRDGIVIGRGRNGVTTCNDPTAHAEVAAIRDACARIQDYRLAGCVIYSSCEPCPMYLGAIYWARLGALYFAATRDDAAAIGFDDRRLYDELPLPLNERSLPSTQLLREEALPAFAAWHADATQTMY